MGLLAALDIRFIGFRLLRKIEIHFLFEGADGVVERFGSADICRGFHQSSFPYYRICFDGYLRAPRMVLSSDMKVSEGQAPLEGYLGQFTGAGVRYGQLRHHITGHRRPGYG